MFQDGLMINIFFPSLRLMAAERASRHKAFLTQRREGKICTSQVKCSNTAFHRFLSSNFRYSFTLFSKFFSSFPHGTCSLSVFHPYLAFDGIYHQLELQSQTTRLFGADLWVAIFVGTGLSPSRADFSQVIWRRRFPRSNSFRLQLRRFPVWAIPSSLAVTRGILVSFFSSA